MRLHRLGWAWTVIAAAAVVVGLPGQTVEAAECWDVVPWGADLFDGSALSGAEAGFLAPVALTSTPPSVVAGGTGMSAGTLAAGQAATGVAAFMAASYGTCKFLDWVSGDAAAIEPPAVGTGTITLGPVQACSAFSAYYATSFPSPRGTWACRQVNSTTPITGTQLMAFSNAVGNTATTRSGVVQPIITVQSPFWTPWESAQGYMIHAGQRAASQSTITWGAASPNCGTGDPTSGWCDLADGIGVVGANPALQAVICPAATMGVGEQCGLTPKLTFGVARRSSNEYGWRGFWNAAPEVHEQGWRRRFVIDVQCYDPGAGTSSWVRTEGTPFWDTQPNQRVPVPSCSTGHRVVAYRIAKVPMGMTCATASGAGCSSITYTGPTGTAPSITLGTATVGVGTRYMVQTWEAPSSWSTPTPPEFVADCMTMGSVCGDPTIDGGICTWGGNPLPAGGTAGCTAGEQLDPDTTTSAAQEVMPAGEVQPTTGEVIDTTDLPTVDEGPDPDPGDGGVIVDVPIDEGDRERCQAVPIAERAACFAGPAIEPGGPCMPDGWGVLNPVEWIERPIKCALVWAFVPDSTAVEDSWNGLLEAANEGAPVSWAVGGLALADEFVTGLPTALEANSDECWQWVPVGPDAAPEGQGAICWADRVAGTAWPPIRTRVGDALWFLWAIGLLFAASRFIGGSHAPPIPESGVQLSLF